MEHAIAEMERRRYEAMRQADIAVLGEFWTTNWFTRIRTRR